MSYAKRATRHGLLPAPTSAQNAQVRPSGSWIIRLGPRGLVFLTDVAPAMPDLFCRGRHLA